MSLQNNNITLVNKFLEIKVQRVLNISVFFRVIFALDFFEFRQKVAKLVMLKQTVFFILNLD